MLISLGFMLMLACALSAYTSAGIPGLAGHNREAISESESATLKGKLDTFNNALQHISEMLNTWTDQHEAMRRSQNEQKQKLISLEFTLNHVLSKLIQLSDRSPLSGPLVGPLKPDDHPANVVDDDHDDDDDGATVVTLASLGQVQVEMSARLSNMLRHLQAIQRQQKECQQQQQQQQQQRQVPTKARAGGKDHHAKARDGSSSSRHEHERQRERKLEHDSDDADADSDNNNADDDVDSIDDRCSSLSLTLQLLERRFEHLEAIGAGRGSATPTKDLKQLQSLAKKNGKMLEHILSALMGADKRVGNRRDELEVRIEAMAGELATFTGSAGLLLKRIERLMRDVSRKVAHSSCGESDRQSDRDDRQGKNNVASKAANGHKILSKQDQDSKDAEEEEHDGNAVDEVEASGENEVNGNAPAGNDQFDEDNTRVKVQAPDLVEDDEKLRFVQPHLLGCHELPASAISGIYKFATPLINNAGRDYNERLCLGNWTIIQNRGPYATQENFNRSWSEYRDGFGSLAAEFWYGNEFIHQLVHSEGYEMRIELQDFEQYGGEESNGENGVGAWAQYGIFRLDNEVNNYNLLVGEHTGSIPDGLTYHNELDFSTYDRRNDKSLDACCSCAVSYASGWWYDNCLEVNLNGVYRSEPNDHNYVGIIWQRWPMDDYSLRSARMMVRPRILRQYAEDP